MQIPSKFGRSFNTFLYTSNIPLTKVWFLIPCGNTAQVIRDAHGKPLSRFRPLLLFVPTAEFERFGWETSKAKATESEKAINREPPY
jgi:hypothetical protein